MDTTHPSAPGRHPTRTPGGRISTLAELHASPVLDVAVLGAAVLAGLHPDLARRAGEDPRHPWQQARDTSRVLRASGVDPCRALALAARERALTHLLPPVPGAPALLHALRVHVVLRTASAVGVTTDRRTAERHVRDQQRAAVLLGAEPDDLPANLDDVRSLVEEVRDRAAVRPGVLRPPSAALCRVLDPRVPEWATASWLVPSLLPAWSRPHLGQDAAPVLDAVALERGLRHVHAAEGAGLSPGRR